MLTGISTKIAAYPLSVFKFFIHFSGLWFLELLAIPGKKPKQNWLQSILRLQSTFHGKSFYFLLCCLEEGLREAVIFSALKNRKGRGCRRWNRSFLWNSTIQLWRTIFSWCFLSWWNILIVVLLNKSKQDSSYLILHSCSQQHCMMWSM